MTMGEFSRKYDVPYQDVHKASFRTATRMKASWALDFDERDLREAVQAELQRRVDYHAEMQRRAEEMLDRFVEADTRRREGAGK